MINTGIFIDDTGTPGIESKSIYDSKDKKSWLALIINSEERIDADFQMRECIKELQTICSAKEFHFKDIYNGNNEFKNISLEIRLNIFRAFAEICRVEQYPMLIQTFTSDDILRNKILVKGKVKVDNFDLSNHRDFALWFLLFRIKRFLKENTQIKLPVEMIIDEGRQKNNTRQDCELLAGFLYNQSLLYKSSIDEPLLQLVDFVAFCLNRVRWILTNNMKNSIDYEFLEICGKANFNILNIEKDVVDMSKNTIEEYDKRLRKVYDKNNNLTDIELEELKNYLKN